MRKPNDVGVGWKQTNERGAYISIKLDLAVLVEMAGGVADTVSISLYPIKSESEKAPHYQLKFYPKSGATRPDATPPAAAATRPPARASRPPADDDIPF